VNWVGGDAGKDIREPGLRIDAIHFRSDDEALHSCGAPPSAIRSAEQPGLPSKSDASQAPFGGISSRMLICVIAFTSLSAAFSSMLQGRLA
jgi:hypothetical protein